MVRIHRPVGKQANRLVQNDALSSVMGTGNQEMEGEL